MEILIMMALAWALGGGVTAGHATAQQHSKTPKPPKPIDRTEAGKKIAQGAINSVARVYTWTSGAKEGWSKAWPETKATIHERRAKVQADKAERKAPADAEKPPKPARTAKAAKGSDESEILDAEIVEDDEEVVNTGGPKAPTAEKIADAKKAAGAAATADTVPPAGANVTGTRPVPPKLTRPPTAGPVPPPRPAPTPPPAAPAPTTGPGADPTPAPAAGPGLRLVKDPEVPPTVTPATPGPATSGAAIPRSSMTNLPTASAGAATVEVNGVDSLQLWLRQMHGWAQLEMEDAQAALTRITDLQAKAEAAYTAAAGAKYDPATLGELAAIVDQLGHLRATREKDLLSSELAAHNATVSESNVQIRHGAANEAAAASPVEMAETTTYGD